ncbi:hypothetical protein SANTM175S_10925 [Streptomyces antimycoticus]
MVSASIARWPSVFGSVKEMSVSPVDAAETFCTTMSMLISASEMVRKMAAASPGLSGTPTTVTLASDVSCATPEMIACSMPSSPSPASGRLRTQVPWWPEKTDRTWMGMLYRRAYSTQRRCNTLEPLAASSSMSSYGISLILRAFFTTRGSAVNTPSTSV